MKTAQNSTSERSHNMKRRERAIVIGGSMAGLLAARVLSDHFEHVTILERDVYPEGCENRRGLPQGHHLHALLARGRKIIEQFFPGICDEMITAGAVLMETGEDLIWLTPHGWGKSFKSGVMILSFSRPFLDYHVRRRLAEIRNIEIITGAAVGELRMTSAGDCVGGVAFHLIKDGEDRADSHEEFLAADLVVDASGRSSRAPQWLTALGYKAPRETVVNAFLGYASRIYRRQPTKGSVAKGVFIQAAPPERTRMGIIFPIEDNRWIATLCGGDRDYPNADEDEYLDFARSLRSSLLYDSIKDCESLSPI